MTDQTQRIVNIIKRNAPMTLLEIAQAELREWHASPQRQDMTDGLNYYAMRTDILQKKRMGIQQDCPADAEAEVYGTTKQVELDNVANNKIAHGFARELCDQKVQYLLGRPFTIEGDKKDERARAYADRVTELLGEDFPDLLRETATAAVNCAVGWQFVYYDAEGQFSIKNLPSVDLRPVWADDAHTKLDLMIYTYRYEKYTAVRKEIVEKVELWALDGVHFYEKQGNVLVPDKSAMEDAGEARKYFTLDENGAPLRPHFVVEGKGGMNWDRLPFIAYKYNHDEKPLICMVKSLIDEYDRTVSYDADTLQDQPNSILVLRNYGGTDLGEFRHNLNVYRAIKTADDGGVDQLATPLDVTASNQHLERIRRDIYSFGRGLDMRGDRVGASASGVALKQEYSALDLDVNGLERGVQRGLLTLLWFVAQELRDGENAPELKFTFSRDIITVESEAIQMCRDSVGIISDETILENHPWVEDVEEEKKRTEAEREEAEKRLGGDYNLNGEGNAKPGILGKPGANAGGSGPPQGA